VKNEWIYTPAPAIRLHSLQRDKFTYTLTCSLLSFTLLAFSTTGLRRCRVTNRNNFHFLDTVHRLICLRNVTFRGRLCIRLRVKKHLTWWTLYIVTLPVNGYHRNSNLLRYASENRCTPLGLNQRPKKPKKLPMVTVAEFLMHC
jgi:hypothetical protein